MAKKTILVKPILTEKAENLSEKQGKYSFVVNKKANKIEIKKAIEAQYNVSVLSVNTSIRPAKAKRRNTKSGVVVGMQPSFKKAFVTLAEGEEIDLYGEM